MPENESLNHRLPRRAPGIRRESDPKGMHDIPPLMLLEKLSYKKPVIWNSFIFTDLDDLSLGQTPPLRAATTKASGTTLRSAPKYETLLRSLSNRER